MKSLKYYLPGITLLLLFALAVGTANAQDARLNFDSLKNLEDKAGDVVEVNLDGKLLDTAKRALARVDDANQKKVWQAVVGLKGIYVRTYNFANSNEYDVADVEQIRSQLKGPSWEGLVNIRSKKNNQKVDVFTMSSGGLTINGIAVVVSEAKSVTVVNIVGEVDPLILNLLGGKMNIPQIDLEQMTNKVEPNKPNE